MKCLSTKLALAAATAGLLFGCTKTDLDVNPGGGDNDDKVAAVIQAGIGGQAQTRAHDAVWDENDAIGLAMLENDGTGIINEVYNYHYFTAANLGIFEPSTSEMMIYFPADGSLVSFRAYYPYYRSLDEHMIVPVNVSGQSTLPEVDFMSADHITGKSKRDPIVKLHFHHRLSKVIFVLSGDNQDAFGDLAEATVTIRGMKTKGKYDLLTETLEVDEESGQAITILRQDGPADQRYGIVLPREAGEGVEFDFTFPKGQKYTAKMGENLDLLPGYKHTFYITLKETGVEVSATIEDWEDGPERHYEAIQATVAAGDNINVEDGTRMDVFISGDNMGYSPLSEFTYAAAEDSWTPSPEVYWESITYDPAYMRASIVMEQPLNSTQAGDWLTSEPVTVPRNNGADFVLSRAVTKLFVELRGDLFSEEQLESAVVTLPGYLTGGYLEEGAFVRGTTRGDILMADDDETGYRVAIFQPQEVSADASLVSIELDGRTYTVAAETGGYEFEAGLAYKFIVNLNKAGLSVGVTIIPWQPGSVENFEAVQITTPAGSSHYVNVGDKIDLYMLDGTNYGYKSTYTYKSDLTWGGAPTIYWDDIPTDPAYFKARMDAADALNDTQLPDVLLSEPTAGYHNRGIDLELNHAAAKAVVSVVSSTFSEAQIAAASITLPGYRTGGSFEGPALIAGTATGDINLVRTGVHTGVAIFEPQTVAAGAPVVAVTIGGNTFTAVADAGAIKYEAGYATTLVVKVEKNGISLSVTVNDWEKGDEYELSTLKIDAAPGENSNVDPGDRMNVYTGANRDLLGTFTYTSGDEWTGPTIYWEDLDDPTTFYASILKERAYDPATMPDDIVLSGPVTAAYGEAVNFTLWHAVAQVAVQLQSTDGHYNDAQLAAMAVTFPQYTTGGSYDNGVFVPGTGTQNVPVVKNTGNANQSGLAFVQEQTIAAGRTVANVATPTRTYPVTYGSDITFRAGYTTLLIIDINKTEIAVSARVIDWEEGQDIQLVANSIEITGDLDGTDAFFNGKTIHLYNINDSEVYPYSYLDGVWSGQKLYWDDYANSGLRLGAVYYPSYFTPAPAGSTTFAVNLPADQGSGWDRCDLLMDYIGYSAGQYRNFNFDFEHVLSQVRIKLVSKEFTDADFLGAKVTINNVILNGTASITGASVTASNTREASLVPQADNNTGREFSALVQPGQQLLTTVDAVTITLPGYPGETFTGRLGTALTLPAGTITTIEVELRRSEVKLSAKVEDWSDNGGGSIIIQ